MRRRISAREVALLILAVVAGVGGVLLYIHGGGTSTSTRSTISAKPHESNSRAFEKDTSLVWRPASEYGVIGHRNLIRPLIEPRKGSVPGGDRSSENPAGFGFLPPLFVTQRSPEEGKSLPPVPVQPAVRTNDLPAKSVESPASAPPIAVLKSPEISLILRTVLDIDGNRSALVEELQQGKSEGIVHLVKAGDSLSGGKVISIRDKVLLWEKEGESMELDIDQPATVHRVAGSGSGKNGSEAHGIEVRIESGNN